MMPIWKIFGQILVIKMLSYYFFDYIFIIFKDNFVINGDFSEEGTTTVRNSFMEKDQVVLINILFF